MDGIEYKIRHPVPREALEDLFHRSWDPPSAPPPLEGSLAWITAHEGSTLVGFVSLAWDGRTHAFLLHPTVLPSHRRQGIGTELVGRAVEQARHDGCEWIHVDYEPHLAGFYERCGFRPTPAGLIRLR